MSYRKNIFDGDSYYAIFVRIIYRHLIKREWISYTDAMKEKLCISSAAELEIPLSKCEHYGELKKAFTDIVKLITLKCGENSIQIKGNNRNKSFLYIGENDDPLAELYRAKIITDFRRYKQFCQDSAGFIPISWFEYFFKDSLDLLEIQGIKNSGKLILNSSVDRVYTNIELLPYLYESIKEQRVLLIEYKPFEENQITIHFHPHIIKEFNGRWFVLGHAENRYPELAFNIAVDRIVKIEKVDESATYYHPPKDYYKNYFNNIIGVSHYDKSKTERVVIRIYSYYTFMLMQTKPLHHSQKIIKYYNKESNKDYGEIEINVELNNEMIGRILQMGDDIEIIEPISIRNTIRDRVINIMNRYK